MLDSLLIQTKLGRSILSKELTKLLRRKLKIMDVEIEFEDGEVTHNDNEDIYVSLNISGRIGEKELANLVDRLTDDG